MSKQAISSADTSLNQVPALHRWYSSRRAKGMLVNTTIVDLGAGKYDAAGLEVGGEGIEYLPFDPYNRTEWENFKALFALTSAGVDVLCANVLNVIAEPEARAELIETAAMADGKAYFTVYEGDRSGVGRRTTKGWQNNRKLADYMPELQAHFEYVYRNGSVLVCWN